MSEELLDETLSGERASDPVSAFLYGRQRIYTSLSDLTEENVISEVSTALSFHNMNIFAEDYLYWYRRGIQPILHRKKEQNDFINNKVLENHAEEIVSFKNGYFLTSPACYVSRKKEKKVIDNVEKLNEYIYLSGKHTVDNKTVDWFHTVGLAPIFVHSEDDADVPFSVYSLDPRCAFVVYSQSVGNKPVYGVNAVVSEDGTAKYDVWTKTKVFHLIGGSVQKTKTVTTTSYTSASSIESVEDNPLGIIPIIEYQYNSTLMGAFEPVISQLDALNILASNRIDGVEQFIQSLAIALNCEFEDGTTASQIRKCGLIAIKSTGQNKADFKILSNELNQDQTQTLVDYIYQQVLTICAMPSTTKGGTSTSDTGAAVLLRDGFRQAESCARNTEDLFKESNRLFDSIVLKILHEKGILTDLNASDFELKFNRNDTSNAQSKVQALQGALAAGVAPAIAFERSGYSNDPVNDVAISEPYLKMIWGDPSNKPKAEETKDDGQTDRGI